MAWHETTDVEQWLAATADLLFHEPGRHTIALTQAENVRRLEDGTRFAWWWDGQDVSGAAVWCEPYPALLCIAPDDALRPLAELWQPTRWSGETAPAVQLASLAARGGGVTVVRAERLFRLGELVMPAVQGRARTATLDDVDLVLAWFQAFLVEAGLDAHDVEQTVRQRLTDERILLWDLDGPRSMAGAHPAAFGAARIGPVYTPREHRGHGYGGAVTAAVSRRALDAGAWEVVLFTDLTNPTSNALYPRVGFAPVTDRAVLEISSP